MVIYCFKMIENRMRKGLILTFQEYHKIGVPWAQTIMTLTFADMVVDTTTRFSVMQQNVKKTLIENVGVRERDVENLKICPTAIDPNKALSFPLEDSGMFHFGWMLLRFLFLLLWLGSLTSTRATSTWRACLPQLPVHQDWSI